MGTGWRDPDTDGGSVVDGAGVVNGTDPLDGADDLQARFGAAPQDPGPAATAEAPAPTGCDTGARGPAWGLAALGALLVRVVRRRR